MKDGRQFHPVPILVGIGAFFILLYSVDSMWTVIGGTLVLTATAWYALHYEEEKRD